MRMLAPLVSPIFASNHHVVLRIGGEVLARRLCAALSANGSA